MPHPHPRSGKNDKVPKISECLECTILSVQSHITFEQIEFTILSNWSETNLLILARKADRCYI